MLAISLTDEQVKKAQELADEYHEGNVSAMFRAVLGEKYPAFKQARVSNRRRQLNKPSIYATERPLGSFRVTMEET